MQDHELAASSTWRREHPAEYAAVLAARRARERARKIKKLEATAWVTDPEAKYRSELWREDHPAEAEAWSRQRLREAKSRSFKKWRAANPGLNRAKMKAYWFRHPERAAEINRRKASRRRAKVRGAQIETVSQRDLAALLRFQEGRCVYCSRILGAWARCRVSRPSTRHLDHVVPLARGGPHALSNLAWACGPCNLAKGVMTAAEFRLQLNMKAAAYSPGPGR